MGGICGWFLPGTLSVNSSYFPLIFILLRNIVASLFLKIVILTRSTTLKNIIKYYKSSTVGQHPQIVLRWGDHKYIYKWKEQTPLQHYVSAFPRVLLPLVWTGCRCPILKIIKGLQSCDVYSKSRYPRLYTHMGRVVQRKIKLTKGYSTIFDLVLMLCRQF